MDPIVGPKAELGTGQAEDARIAGPEHLDPCSAAQSELLQPVHVIGPAEDAAYHGRLSGIYPIKGYAPVHRNVSRGKLVLRLSITIRLSVPSSTRHVKPFGHDAAQEEPPRGNTAIARNPASPRPNTPGLKSDHLPNFATNPDQMNIGTAEEEPPALLFLTRQPRTSTRSSLASPSGSLLITFIVRSELANLIVALWS